MLDCLEGADGLPELVSFLRIPDPQFECAAPNPDECCGSEGAPLVERTGVGDTGPGAFKQNRGVPERTVGER